MVEELVMDFVKQKTALFQSASPEEKVCYILPFSGFLPYVMTGAVVLSALIYIISKKRFRNQLLRAEGLKWFGLFCIPVFFAPMIHQHLLGFVAGLGLIAVVLVGVWISQVMHKQLFENCMDIAVMMSVPAAMICFAQKFISLFTMKGVDYRAMSVFFNPNYYGAIIELVALICIYKMLNTDQIKQKLIYFSIIGINFLALYIADSFSAWAAIGASVFALLFVTKQYKFLGCCAAVAAFAAVLVICVPEIMPRMSFVDKTMSKRMHIWSSSFYGFLENPLFGKGTLSYFLVSANELKPSYVQPHAHNIILDVLLNYGLLGTAAAATFVIRRYAVHFKNIVKSANKTLYLFLFAVVVAVCVHGITDVTLLWHQTGLLALFLFSGLCMESNEQEAEAVLPLNLRSEVQKGLTGLEGAILIRQEVFIQEQGFVNEFDEHDKDAYHVVLYNYDEPIATGRTFLNEDGVYVIGRVAVRKAYRKHHVGSVVIGELEQQIRALGGNQVKLSAQLQAQGFYEKMGYSAHGAGYYDEHTPHIEMVKNF